MSLQYDTPASRYATTDRDYRRIQFDPDPVGFAYEEVPPPPWTCSLCARTTKALALFAGSWNCDSCFGLARALGFDPEITDAVVAS